jgi:hypothetical protein
VGLLLYGYKHAKGNRRGFNAGRSMKRLLSGNRLLDKMSEWFKEIF